MTPWKFTFEIHTTGTWEVIHGYAPFLYDMHESRRYHDIVDLCTLLFIQSENSNEEEPISMITEKGEEEEKDEEKEEEEEKISEGDTEVFM